MTFEEVLREKLANNPSKVAKGILKVVLGEYQQKNSLGAATGYDAYAIIEKIIGGNNETLGILKPDDARRVPLEEENTVVTALLTETVAMGLLPYYHTQEEVYAKVQGDQGVQAQVNELLAKVDRSLPLDDNKNKRWVGQATGVIVKWFQAQKLDVKGEVVKQVIAQLQS